MNKLKTLAASQKTFLWLLCILLLCTSYLIFELTFIPQWVLAADEFVFAKHIYEYTWHIPYQDFPPYKSVLGYYLLSIPLFFSQQFLQPLFYIKDEIATLNMLALALSIYWASRLFDRRAVLLSALAILANQFFLVYAVDLRVDMLTSWFCLFAALSMLEQRFFQSGILISVAFLISQKAIWYFVAINGALIFYLLVQTQATYTWRKWSIFNLAVALPILLYIGFWLCFTDLHTLVSSLFYEAYVQAGIQWYSPIYVACWNVILSHGPLLFFLWPVASLALLQKQIASDFDQRLFIVSFAFIALFLFITYKQAFPYNTVLTVPVFFILYASFLNLLLSNHQTAENPIHPKNRYLLFITCSYSLAVICLVKWLELAPIYYLIASIPIALGDFFWHWFKKANTKLLATLILMLFSLTGILYPLSEAIFHSKHLNGQYQQKMLALVADLLKEDGDYIAGIPFLYQKEQPIAGMKNLIGPALAYLAKPDPTLKPLLLPSLYLDAVTTTEVLQDFDKMPIKVIINNYRMKSLPQALHNYIKQNYQQFSGSIYLYAPTIPMRQLTFFLKFKGNYILQTRKRSHIIIDGQRYRSGQVIHLEKGDHVSDANAIYRLVLKPDVPKPITDLKDTWLYMIKAILT